MMNTISILGSTGSIGRQTLDEAKQLGLRVAALTANSNVERMEAQCRKFRPRLAVMTEEAAAKELAVRLQDTSVKVLAGTDALVDAAVIPEAETVVTAVVGMVGLKATLAAIREKKRIALANKETLVCGGELVMREISRAGVELMPVDSEHSALWQALGFRLDAPFRRLIITASGGPFYSYTEEQLKKVTFRDALKHPTWNMGAKITVDSATLLNKGFEVIEAKWLYGTELKKIHTLVQPESIIHSMVEFDDGGILAQLSYPSMELPIQLALTYPKRMDCGLKPLDFESLGALRFLPLERKRFPCYDLALSAAETGDNYPCALNAAGEIAVGAFLKERISFPLIAETIKRTLEKVSRTRIDGYEALAETDAAARRYAAEFIAGLPAKTE